MTNKIYVTGAKGGAGVSTCCVGLCKALAERGERTLLFDGDKYCAQALGIAGMWGLSVYTLGDAEKGACRVKQAILQHPNISNFYILPSLECKNEKFLCEAVREIEGLFDYIICDKVAREVCDRAILITEPYHHSLKCADKALSFLCDEGMKNVSVIINKVNGGLVFDGEIMTPQEIATILHAKLLAIIPEDLSLPLGKCKAETAKAFKLTAENLSGKSEKTLSVIKPYLGVSGLIKRKLRTKL
jgi:septum formation inhibitor-activating ATPase MinD